MRRYRSTRRSPLRALLIAAAVLILGVGFVWTQQNLIQTEVIDVTTEGLPGAFDGLRVAVVSDVHGKQFGSGNAELLRAVEKLEPDLIAITGDLVESREQLAMVPALARGLAEIAPTYYVTGNHEWAAKVVPDILTLLQENGVITLSNETVTLEKDGQHLFLMGINDPNGPADQKTLAQQVDELRTTRGEGVLLLLAHRNNRPEEYAAAGVDLTLAGHAHGGLVRLPFTDGLIGPNHEWFPSYTAGLYRLSYGQLAVSRGLGNVGRTLRLFNRPHLPLVVLHAAAQ